MKKGKGAVLFGVIIQTFEQKLLQLSFTLGPIFEGCRGKIRACLNFVFGCSFEDIFCCPRHFLQLDAGNPPKKITQVNGK